ncbi:MAG: hypothetical protein JWL86_6015 [Rhizobium sp.]|nr:hypothetical protein [Rhizobium sp.]
MKRSPSQFETALRTFTFGLTAYALTYIIYTLLGYDFYIPEVKKDATFIADRKYVGEFLGALFVAFGSSILWLYAYNRKLLGRFLRAIGATKKYGDEDVWDYAFNSADPRAEYVYVRDYKNNKVLSGWVAAFSETDKVRELLLRDVQVYNLEGDKLYEVPLLYVGRPTDEVDVEFPFKSGQQGQP